jgi:hypothetical protein
MSHNRRVLNIFDRIEFLQLYSEVTKIEATKHECKEMKHVATYVITFDEI